MKKLFIIILFVSKASFANDLPELGSHFDNLLTASDEKKITFQIFSQVYQSNNVINDSEINNYIERLGRKLSMEGTEDKLSLKLNYQVILLFLKAQDQVPFFLQD